MNTSLMPYVGIVVLAILGGVVAARRGWGIPDRIPLTWTTGLLALVVGISSIARIWLTSPGTGINLGYYANAAWNISHGRFYASDWFDNILSYHALVSGPWLYMPALLVGHFFAFCVMHQVYVVAGAVALAHLADNVTGRRSWGVVVAILFLFNPYITAWLSVAFLNDSPVFVLLPLAFLAGEQGRRHRSGILGLIAACLLEDIGFGIMLYWIIEMIRRRGPKESRIFPAWLGLALVVFFGLYYGALRPVMANRGSEVQHLVAVDDILRDPLGVAQQIFTRTKVGFLAHTIYSTAGLPLLAPVLMFIALPDAVFAILTPTFEVHSIATPYLPGLAVALFLSVVYGFRRLERIIEGSGVLAGSARRRHGVQAGLMLFAVLSQLVYTHTPIATALREGFMIRPRYTYRALDMIPEGDVVASNSKTFYGIAYDRRCILLDDAFLSWTAAESESKALQAPWLVLDPGDTNSGARFIRKRIESGFYSVEYETPQEIVARRRPNSIPLNP